MLKSYNSQHRHFVIYRERQNDKLLLSKFKLNVADLKCCENLSNWNGTSLFYKYYTKVLKHVECEISE